MNFILRIVQMAINSGARQFAISLVQSPTFHKFVNRTNRKLQEVTFKMQNPGEHYSFESMKKVFQNQSKKFTADSASTASSTQKAASDQANIPYWENPPAYAGPSVETNWLKKYAQTLRYDFLVWRRNRLVDQSKRAKKVEDELRKGL